MVGRRPPHQRRLAGWSPVSTGWPCAVAVACLLALIASLTPAAATAAANTKATRYTPFGPDGQINPDLQLVPRTGGDCWTSSSVTRRHDAWRCSEHNVIRDPCFLGADPQSVVCPIDGPFSGRAVLLGVISDPLQHGGHRRPVAALGARAGRWQTVHLRRRRYHRDRSTAVELRLFDRSACAVGESEDGHRFVDHSPGQPGGPEALAASARSDHKRVVLTTIPPMRSFRPRLGRRHHAWFASSTPRRLNVSRTSPTCKRRFARRLAPDSAARAESALARTPRSDVGLRPACARDHRHPWTYLLRKCRRGSQGIWVARARDDIRRRYSARYGTRRSPGDCRPRGWSGNWRGSTAGVDA